MVKYQEIKGDLFSASNTISLAHCVSEDLAMSKGIAAIFKKKFDGVKQLEKQGNFIIVFLLKDDYYQTL